MPKEILIDKKMIALLDLFLIFIRVLKENFYNVGGAYLEAAFFIPFSIDQDTLICEIDILRAECAELGYADSGGKQ